MDLISDHHILAKTLTKKEIAKKKLAVCYFSLIMDLKMEQRQNTTCHKCVFVQIYSWRLRLAKIVFGKYDPLVLLRLCSVTFFISDVIFVASKSFSSQFGNFHPLFLQITKSCTQHINSQRQLLYSNLDCQRFHFCFFNCLVELKSFKHLNITSC